MGISEKQKEELRAEAKQILNGFAKALAGVKLESSSEKINGAGYREKSDIKNDPEFRKRMFANAPKANDNYIVAEKKKW